MSAPDRRAMLDRADETLSVRRQCALLGVARSGVYRVRKPANDKEAARIFRTMTRAGFPTRIVINILKKWDVDDEVLSLLESDEAGGDNIDE